VHAGLLRLALQRSLSSSVFVPAVLLAWILPKLDWAPPSTLPLAASPDSGAAGLVRQGVWSAFLLVLGPLLVIKSAATVGFWRRGEVDWLASAPVSRAKVVLSTWSGMALAAALVLAVGALSAELGAGPGGAGRRFVATLDTPRTVLIEDRVAQVWTSDSALLAAGRSVRAHLILVGGGPTAEIRFAARRGNGPWSETQRTLSSHTEIALDLPAGAGPVEFSLERTRRGSIVFMDPRGLEVLAPVASSRRASLALFVHAWIALATALAIAFGLGACASTAGAATLTLTLLLPAWLGTDPVPWWPWGNLPQALTMVGEGFAPATPSTAEWLGTIALCSAGLASGVLGLRTWRRAA